ncbi:magnesium transporter CorA family protein [uncultured Oxalicibacterium sp.]|uniref:magnesium transporter CorA family protein n=1 Tax=uncultured Oxalicibacterium sp. TaxID=1168540 RepID=UPI0025F3C284|nr:magnesium transporter CorA family protein [uncultured Oxalicibacterium sp.]
MHIYHIEERQTSVLDSAHIAPPTQGYLWITSTHDEIGADPEGWRSAIEQITGIRPYDLHLQDALNQKHPSYFDSTQDYAMVVFRKLALPVEQATTANSTASANDSVPILDKLRTQPVTFVLADHVVITVHAANSRTIEAMRTRLLDYRYRPENGTQYNRPPASPAELALRLLNAMVDQYLDLRQPLTAQIDRWQRALLHPRRPFRDWNALLDARIELRKLDHLCEEQHDALQELRDYFVDSTGDGIHGRAKDLLLVRVHDVMEHITRTLNHARRLESSLESAVQIHFSAMAHRTSEIMRTLTVITALFMPLTLITGIFGMNFITMPLLQDHYGFWITVGCMLAIMIGLLIFFRRKHYLEDRILDRK